VLFATVGSRGDVQPMLVLGRELVRRGHRVLLAAPPNFRDDVANEPGLEFLPIGSDTALLIEEHRELAEASPLRSLPGQVVVIRREAERQIRDLLAFSEPMDLVVAAGLSFGARTWADRTGAAYVNVAFSFSALRSHAHPPAALPVFGLPRLGNAALWGALVTLFDRTLGGMLARERRALGLAPCAPWASIHGSHTLLAQDEIMGAVAADAQGYAGRVPALVNRAPLRPLPDELERFLSADRTPLVYLGFGSMPAVDRERLTTAARELARRSKARVVLFSSYGERRFEALDERVFRAAESDHRALFPRMDLLVHHGGAGTTAAALRAGVPQLVVPHIQDQFAHGRRIAELGLGPSPVPKAKLTPEALLAALGEAPSYREQARAVASTLAGQSGAAAAAEHLEGLAAERSARAAPSR
jgi:vancomycin aglycone glucosyltransferase